MQLKKMVFTALLVITLIAMLTIVVIAQPMRYKADLYIDFKFERTIEIIFDPAVGTQKATVFETAARVAITPSTPSGGESVDLIKDGDRWSFRRASAVRSANIKRDENGKLIIFYFARGSNYAEGELKPVK